VGLQESFIADLKKAGKKTSMNNTKNPISASTIFLNHPPASSSRRPLAFRVGVVGHRPDRLKNADINQLKQVLKTILGVIKDEVLSFSKSHAHLYDPSPPVLRAISPLAEGADRLFAEQALDLVYELWCLMPFAQAEFEKDFAPEKALEPDSLARFQGMLSRAEKETGLTRIELDGNRDTPELAYGDAGRAVLDQSDLLITVWDGELTGKPGGTEEAFRDAMNRGKPIVLVDARAPHGWRILKPGNCPPPAISRRRWTPNGCIATNELQELIKKTLTLLLSADHCKP
jgi:hypothetical protein